MRFCKIADIEDWQDQDFQVTASLLNLPTRDRKSWEFIQVYNGLQQLGLLNGESSAIGLGVGSEPLIYAFTNVCQQVVATDLYESENWSTAAMTTQAVYQLNPFPYQADRLLVQQMDMTQIAYPDQSFDFVWSCCSIEHVNNFQDLHKVYAEIHRVLKPGGIAALTTEYNPTELRSYEPNMLFTDRPWIDRWLTGSNPLIQGFEQLDPIDFSLSPAPENQPKSRRFCEGSIQVYTNDIFLNSVAFFLRKTGEFSQPYDQTWLSPLVNAYFAGCDAEKIKDFDQAKALFEQVLQDRSIDSRLRVGTASRLINIFQEQEQTEAVLQACRAIVPYCLEVECSDHLLPIAHACRRLGLWEEAKLLYEKIEHLPGAALNQVIRCIVCQAQYFAHQGDNETALKLTQTAQPFLTPQVGNENRNVYLHLGIYNERLQKFAVAIEAYRTAAEFAVADARFYENCQLRISKCVEKLELAQTPSQETPESETSDQLSKSLPPYSGWITVKNFLRMVYSFIGLKTH
jgi:SAM-dependent methyltransferase